MTDSSHFEVSYKINPWMTPDEWRMNETANRAAAHQSQRQLAEALRAGGAHVITIEGAPGLPDMVFPANAAVVLNKRALVARFRHYERQGEERYFLQEFRHLTELGLLECTAQMHKRYFHEGAGDCIWDATRHMFWTGYGPRSSFEAIDHIRDYFGEPVTPLELVSGRFYHLDTCFACLSHGEVLYYPPAFSKAALATIHEHVPQDMRIEASDEDAARFSVNAVNFGNEIVMAEPTDQLADTLRERGYTVSAVNLKPFIMSGGGAYCKTLRLDLKSNGIAKG